MSNMRNPNCDCTDKCRYRMHGAAITAAITKRNITDEAMAAFLTGTCNNFVNVADELGRSAVHMSASVGRYALCEWLINQGAIINGHDFESGSTPLHRAIYYGSIDCAILLLRYGAQLDLDKDSRCPLQLVCRYRDFCSLNDSLPNNELLVWGSNKNYNLGLGNEEGSTQPHAVDFFRKQHINIETIALGAYHSLFLDKKFQLYAVGHGEGGRLGNNNETTLVAPKKMKVPIKYNGEVIIGMSVSRTHSLLLTNYSSVFACGLNDAHQLGIPNCGKKLTAFRLVTKLRDLDVSNLVRVVACDHYSIAYSQQEIYAWGTNTGQFCLNVDTIKTVEQPILLRLPARAIMSVEANSAAIGVVTGDHAVVLLYNAKAKIIKTPNFENVKAMSLSGGDNIKSAKGTATALKLLVLTKTNVAYIWYEIKQMFYRCVFADIRLTQIDRIFYRGNQLLILSLGDVYRGKCSQVPVPAYMVEEETSSAQIAKRSGRSEINTEYMMRMDLERIANVDRAVEIFCDAEFLSFAALQESPHKYFRLPTLTPEEYAFKKLYVNVSECDAVHDVVFKLGAYSFPAHMLILAARAPGLYKHVEEMECNATDKKRIVHLNIDNLTGHMFQLMLKHIYTNYFPTENDLDNMHHSLGRKTSIEGSFAVCQLFVGFVAKFEIKSLENYLKSFLVQEEAYFYLPNNADKSKYRFSRLRPIDFPSLHDVRIICANGEELVAHKCVLVGRLDYFNLMFTHTWAEHSVITLSTVPVEYMRPILDFLYTADVEHFRRQNFSETFLYNMVVFCDQFFIERLRKVCEIAILDKITLRKCADMLYFAHQYNCEVLQSGCMDFICQNLARVLSFRILEQCEPNILGGLNAHYRHLFQSVFDYRVITPDSNALEDAVLLKVADSVQVDLNYRMTEDAAAKATVKHKSADIKKNPIAKPYEREAISSLRESLQRSIERESHESVTTVISEAQSIAEKLLAQAKSWMKVPERKDARKNYLLERTVKANETLQFEDKPRPLLEPLTPNASAIEMNTSQTSDRMQPSGDDTTPAKAYNFSLADITPTREKLSQKQRRLLVSESSSSSVASAAALTSPMKATPEQPNAWGLMSQSPGSSAGASSSPSPSTGSMADPSSFANMMRGGAAASTADSSFTQILADEREQRDQYLRMRHKPLALTQIEETAIAELGVFYNINNVVDEIITIERKPRPMTMNFAVWPR